MKISEIITDKYKLRMPPTVYYELLADVREVEEDQEPTTKNDLGVDCISREQALVAIRNLYPSMPRVDFNGSLRKWVDKYKPYIECDDAIKELPSVTPQEPKIVTIAENKYDKEKLKELVNKAVLTVAPQEPQIFKWCDTCKEYDQEKHCCHRWSKVIRNTVEEMKQEYIEREVLDKIRAELHVTAEMHEDGDYYLRDEWIDEYFDKYKAESEKTDG